MLWHYIKILILHLLKCLLLLFFFLKWYLREVLARLSNSPLACVYKRPECELCLR